MAPSRPIPITTLGFFRARSQSEPNIPELYSNTNVEEDEPELSFLEEGGVHLAGDTPLLHVSSIQLDQEGKGMTGSPQLSSLLVRVPQSTPVDKSENIRNFLASLPYVTVEDDPGLGDNMCTSESGSGYSSPISTPTDDDHHLHCRYNKLAKEIRREYRATSELQQPKLLREEEEVREDEGVGGTDGGSGDVPNQHDKSEESEPPSQKKVALSSSVPEMLALGESETSRAVSTDPEATRDETGGTAMIERFQPIADIPIFQGIPKPLHSTSLPRNMMTQYPEPPLEGSPDAMSESLLAEHGSTSISVSESNYETSLSPGEQSNQQKAVKLDVPSASGLVELPQIHSVPERIKEIEEMHSLKGLSKSPTVPPLGGGGGGGNQSADKNDKCELSTPDDTTDVNRECVSITRTSSGHSIMSSLSVGDEEMNLLNDNGNSNDDKSRHMVPARHSSLSPNPAPLTPRMESDMHGRTASCSNLLSNSSEPLVNEPVPSLLPSESGNMVVMELVGSGAVKARVLDIEERNKDERSASSDELSLRRHSPPFQQRASSSSGGVVIPEAVMSSCEARNLKQLILAQQRRPSSEIIQECLPPSSSHHRRETSPPAFLSAWSKLVDEIPTMPVQDLKKKFEDSDAVSLGSSIGSGVSARLPSEVRRGNLRRSQSLRAVDSPGKRRHRFRALKKLYSNQNGPGGSVHGRTSSPCSQD